MSNGPVIETDALTRRAAGRTVVEGVTLSAPVGCILGLIGPRGSGKSAILRMLAGLERATGGTMRVAGVDPAHDSGRIRRVVGYVPAVFDENDHICVREYLTFFAAAFRVPARHRRACVDQALAATESIHLADRLVDALTVAQRRHVELSRAVLHQPKVVLMDGPADGLADAAWVVLEQQIRRIAEAGVTVAVTGCVYNRIVDLCDPVAVIVDGQMRAFGTPAQLAAHFARRRIIEVRLASAAQTGRAADVLDGFVGDATHVVRYDEQGLVRITTDSSDAQVARWVAGIVEQGLQITCVRELQAELDASMLGLRRDSNGPRPPTIEQQRTPSKGTG